MPKNTIVNNQTTTTSTSTGSNSTTTTTIPTPTQSIPINKTTNINNSTTTNVKKNTSILSNRDILSRSVEDDEFNSLLDDMINSTNKKKQAMKQRDKKIAKKKKEREERSRQQHEDQQNEIDALSAIFQDDFVLIDDEERVWSSETYRFSIHIIPFTNGPEEEYYVAVDLDISFQRDYPNSIPLIQVIVKKGPTKYAAELEQLLKQHAEASLGSQMVFDLCGIAKEFLNQHNHKPSTKSFHQQMVEQNNNRLEEQKQQQIISLDSSNQSPEHKQSEDEKDKEWESTLEDTQLKEDRKNFRLQKSLERAQHEKEKKQSIVEQFTTNNQDKDLNKKDNINQKDNNNNNNHEIQFIDKQQTIILHLLRLICQSDQSASLDQIKLLGTQLVQLGIINQTHLALLNMNSMDSNQIYQQIFQDYFSKPLTEIKGGGTSGMVHHKNNFVSRFWSSGKDLPIPNNSPSSRGGGGGGGENMIISPPKYTPLTQTAMQPQTSRYRGDFEELQLLGRGGFGQVIKVRNKLDGRYYAVKKIKLDSDQTLNKRILREVITLSRLHHQHIVRYYQAWIEGSDNNNNNLTLQDDDEDEFGDGSDSSDSDSSETESDEDDILFQKQSIEYDLTDDSYSYLHSDSGFLIEVFDLNKKSRTNTFTRTSSKSTATGSSSRARKNKKKNSRSKHSTACLYIQMEYCQKILRNLTESGISTDDDDIWKLFRQIVEGMAYVHSQGIIHRDLKPSNIFFDSCGDIKIGDFGLAISSTRLADSDQHQGIWVTDNSDMGAPGDSFSLDGGDTHTAHVGTMFYTSPEQESGGEEGYDDKVDMYSLGIVFFEMWYVFSTGHERVSVLKDIREHAKFPDDFERTHPRQAKLIRWLTDRDPAKRPSAQELLQSELMPPKMEDEYMTNAIRVITNPTTQFYQHMLNSLFSSTHQHLHSHIYHQSNNSDNLSSSLFQLTNIQTREMVNDIIIGIFKKHNCLSLSTPIMNIIKNWEKKDTKTTEGQLNKKSSTNTTTRKDDEKVKEKSSQKDKLGKSLIMDDSGQLFELRVDLRHSFVDFLADHLINKNTTPGKSMNNSGGNNGNNYNLEELLEMFAGQPLKRYEIGNVYRKPNLVGKAPKELSQCSFDIVGTTSLLADAEVIKVTCEIFEALSSISNYTVRINHTGIVDYMWRIVGITDETMKNDVALALSQLLRQPWTSVKKILLERLQLPPKQVERLANWILVKGSIPDVVRKLESSTAASGSIGLLSGGSQANVRVSSSFGDFIDDMKTLGVYLERMGVTNRVQFDLGYVYSDNFYNGVMFQAVLKEDARNETVIAVGGRYDKSVTKQLSKYQQQQQSQQSSSSSSNQQQPNLIRNSDEIIGMPVVGLSIALDKLYHSERLNHVHNNNNNNNNNNNVVSGNNIPVSSTTSSLSNNSSMRNTSGNSQTATQVPDIFVCSLGGASLFVERIGIVAELWNAGYRVDTIYKETPAPEEQTEQALSSGAPFIVILKEKGNKKIIKIKNIEKKKEEEILRDDLVKFFRRGGFDEKEKDVVNNRDKGEKGEKVDRDRDIYVSFRQRERENKLERD